MESKCLRDFGVVHLPLMKRLYFASMKAGADSGAGSYSQRLPKSSSRAGWREVAFLAGMGRVNPV